MSTLDITIAGGQLIEGPAGPMEVFVDAPQRRVHGGIAIVAHPQPLLGGNAMHKVPQLCDSRPNLRIALVGFSFGAFVQARVASALEQRAQPAWRVCLAGLPFGPVEGRRVYDTPRGVSNALVVHGEQDERVSLGAVLEWARPHTQPVVVVPGADHFFTGKLHILRNLVLSHLDA